MSTITREIRTVGFIGLGDQGAPMARAIAHAGFDLHVWARRPASLEAVADVAHTVSDSVDALAQRCDLIGLCLRTDDDIDELLNAGLLSSMMPGSVLANHGTGSPDVCDAWAVRAAQSGVVFLDAPVSGGRAAAEQCTLTTMVGGNRAGFDASKSVFDSFSQVAVHLGGPGAGQMAKLVNNVVLCANLRTVSDTLDVAERLGFDVPGLVALLSTSSSRSFALEAVDKHMSSAMVGHFQQMLDKDVKHFIEAAHLRGVELPSLEQAATSGVSALVGAVEQLTRLRGTSPA